MRKIYLIEFGGKKEMDEMDALELKTIDDALDWIQNSMESDSEYFNVPIDCTIYEKRNASTDRHCEALVYIEGETIVTPEMFESGVYSIETVIETNLSVVSKIINKGEMK